MESWRTPLRWVLTTMMVVLGVLHFVAADAFAQIVPPQLPWPYALVPPAHPALLWGRLPLQAVFVAWALWVSKPRVQTSTRAA